MKEDTLDKSPYAQRWVQKGEEKGAAQTARQFLLAFVRIHFPEQLPLAEKLAKDVEEPAKLQDVMLKISTAHNEQEVTLALAELAR